MAHKARGTVWKVVGHCCGVACETLHPWDYVSGWFSARRGHFKTRQTRPGTSVPPLPGTSVPVAVHNRIVYKLMAAPSRHVQYT